MLLISIQFLKGFLTASLIRFLILLYAIFQTIVYTSSYKIYMHFWRTARPKSQPQHCIATHIYRSPQSSAFQKHVTIDIVNHGTSWSHLNQMNNNWMPINFNCAKKDKNKFKEKKKEWAKSRSLFLNAGWHLPKPYPQFSTHFSTHYYLDADNNLRCTR